MFKLLFLGGFESPTFRWPQPPKKRASADSPVPRTGADRRSIFVKSGLRRAQAISVVHLAAVIAFDPDDGRTVTDATIALGSVAPTIVTVPGLADALRGRVLDTDACNEVARLAAAAASPIDDLRATAEYRMTTAKNLLRRFWLEHGAGEPVRLAGVAR